MYPIQVIAQPHVKTPFGRKIQLAWMLTFMIPAVLIAVMSVSLAFLTLGLSLVYLLPAAISAGIGFIKIPASKF